MPQRTLGRTQLVLASAAAVLGAVGGWWSWRVRDHRGLTLALLIVAITGISVVLTRLTTRAHLDHSA
jgi:hypothetical protein